MIAVIADDITGAAEIGGIALRYGKKTVMTTQLDDRLPQADVLVVATDTRSDTEAGAAGTVRQIAHRLKGSGAAIFKKTDSVMRGHVVAEIKAIMAETGHTGALLLPQNPSKGRTIKDGVYYVGGVRLSDTAFGRDPEYPALTSSAEDLLGGAAAPLAVGGAPAPGCTIHIADAGSTDDIRAQLAKASRATLLAGGADLFESVVAAGSPPRPCVPAALPPAGRVLVICGSTQGTSPAGEPYIRSLGGCEAAMPAEVFHGGNPAPWAEALAQLYKSHRALIVGIGRKENMGPAYASRLRLTMADVAATLVGRGSPDIMAIEGGATAYAIMQRLGWHSLTLRAEYSPGVVGMVHNATEIILKPGSYPWGSIFSAHDTQKLQK